MTTRPPFISERLHERKINGCTMRSGLMSLGTSTDNELLQDANNRQLRPEALHQLAELLEPGPPTQTRGFDPVDFNNAVQKHWPWFPQIPSWDNPKAMVRIGFTEWKQRIINGESGILQGNAARVKDPKSPLHKFVGDVGHAIEVNEGNADHAFLIDPMGEPLDTYDGDQCAWKDLEEFASEFSKSYGFILCSLMPAGSQSKAAITQRKLDAANSRITTLNATLDSVKATATRLNTELIAAQAAQKTAEAATALAQTAQKAAEDALAPAQAAAADLTAKLATANDTIATQTTSLASLQTDLDTANATAQAHLDALNVCQGLLTDATASVAALQTKVDEQATALSTCMDRVVADAAAISANGLAITDLRNQLTTCQNGTELLAANQKIADLTKQNATLTTSLDACTKAAQSSATFFARLKAVLARFGL